MITFLLIIAAIGGTAFVLNALLNFLGRSWRPLFIGVTFVVVGIGAYAASFLTDIIAQACFGQLPSENIVWPCISWSTIAWCSLAICARRPVPLLARTAPFWIFGGEAAIASFVHPWNLITAASLILAGAAYGLFGGQKGDAVIRASRREVERWAGQCLAPAIGPYQIDMETADISELVELTQAERNFLTAGGMEFSGERIFHALPADFAGITWEIILGAVDGRVYKVSASVSAESRYKRDSIWQITICPWLEKTLGNPEKPSGNIAVWDTEDGNVLVDRAEALGVYAVNLTITSRAVRSFVRVK